MGTLAPRPGHVHDHERADRYRYEREDNFDQHAAHILSMANGMRIMPSLV